MFQVLSTNIQRFEAVVVCVFTIVVFGQAQSLKPIDLHNFDTTVKPTEDFYKYVNGNWMKNHPIPPDRIKYGSPAEVQERNFAVLHQILDSASSISSATKGSIIQKVGDFYYSGMDSTAIEKQGLFPLTDEFNSIARIKASKDIIDVIASLQKEQANIPFGAIVAQDFQSSDRVIANVFQSGLAMPDREYYVADDKDSKVLRKQYLEHVSTMFHLLGDDEKVALANAKSVMKFETRLARVSMSAEDSRDMEIIYHKVSLADAELMTPGIAWKQYFQAIGLTTIKEFNLCQPDFCKEIGVMITSVSVDEWKTYLRWQVINFYAEYLNSDFVTEHFNFFGKILNGQEEMEPRWKRVLQTMDENMGEALGQLFVARTFGGKAKERTLEMAINIRDAYRERIRNVDWMGKPTKKAALEKLDAMRMKIGYPDKWRDYTGLAINRGSYVLNVLAALRFEFNRNIKKINQPVDRAEWGLTPPSVEAYYDVNANEIVFRAGFLQPPYFEADADDAVNYGAIGAIFGHELTHGFDDVGRKFDAHGNMLDWWNADDGSAYDEKSAEVEKQYKSYIAFDKLHVNGKLTLGENIADIGGLMIAYDALERSLAKTGRPANIDGFTPEQRFFISYAQAYRQNIRPEALKGDLTTNPHAPARFRCIGPISNMEEWKEAFNAKEGDKMVRKNKLKIW